VCVRVQQHIERARPVPEHPSQATATRTHSGDTPACLEAQRPEDVHLLIQVDAHHSGGFADERVQALDQHQVACGNLGQRHPGVLCCVWVGVGVGGGGGASQRSVRYRFDMKKARTQLVCVHVQGHTLHARVDTDGATHL
jgi:hypothetical protein